MCIIFSIVSIEIVFFLFISVVVFQCITELTKLNTGWKYHLTQVGTNMEEEGETKKSKSFPVILGPQLGNDFILHRWWKVESLTFILTFKRNGRIWEYGGNTLPMRALIHCFLNPHFREVRELENSQFSPFLPMSSLWLSLTCSIVRHNSSVHRCTYRL